MRARTVFLHDPEVFHCRLNFRPEEFVRLTAKLAKHDVVGYHLDIQATVFYALSQLVPGATNVNLAVFIGTQMRGIAGALACFLGLTGPPVLIVLVTGYLYLHSQGQPVPF